MINWRSLSVEDSFFVWWCCWIWQSIIADVFDVEKFGFFSTDVMLMSKRKHHPSLLLVSIYLNVYPTPVNCAHCVSIRGSLTLSRFSVWPMHGICFCVCVCVCWAWGCLPIWRILLNQSFITIIFWAWGCLLLSFGIYLWTNERAMNRVGDGAACCDGSMHFWIDGFLVLILILVLLWFDALFWKTFRSVCPLEMSLSWYKLSACVWAG